MKSNEFNDDDFNGLREKSEKFLNNKDSEELENLEEMDREEILHFFHEHQVYQIELELQNEELREAQSKLEKARTRYYELFDLAPVGYCTLSRKGVIEEVNLAAISYLGEPREEFVGKEFSQYILPEDQDTYYFFQKNLFATGNPQDCELRMQKSGGEILWIRLQAEIIQRDKEKPSVFLTLENITKRVEEQIKRRERNKELKGLYFTSELVQNKDRSINNILSLLCRKITDFFKHPEKTCTRISFGGEEYLSENFRETDCRLKSEIIIEGDEKGAIEIFALDKETEDSKNFFVKEERDLIQEISRILSNDFSRRKTEKELRNNKNLLQSLANKTPGAVYQYQLFPDGSSSFPYATEDIYEIYEVTPQEAKEDADRVFDRIHPEDYDRVAASIKESAKNLTVWEEEYRVRLSEKGQRWLEGYAEPEKRPDGSIIWHGNIRDITERKEREKKLQKQKKQIEELNDKLNANIESARMMHSQFLPDSLPEVNNLSFSSYYKPANRLGGDFYDVIEFEDKLLFYITDVSGHDLSASMLNIFLKETIASYLFHSQQTNKKNELSPAGIIQHVNKRFQEESFPADYFICLVVGTIDKRNFEINLSNAGIHFLPLFIQRKGSVSSILCSGMPVTIVNEDFTYKNCNYILQPGETLIMNTDGLFEQTNSQGNMYGEERLLKILIQNADLKPEEMVDKIYEDFSEFKGNVSVQDDLTSLLIQREFD